MDKLNVTQKAILKEFNSNINNKELYRRYEGFLSAEKGLKERQRRACEAISQLEGRKAQLADLIGSNEVTPITEKWVAELKQNRTEYKQWVITLSEIQPKIRENDHLIKLYKLSSDNKVMLWYTILKAAKVINVPYLQWVIPYRDVII